MESETTTETANITATCTSVSAFRRPRAYTHAPATSMSKMGRPHWDPSQVRSGQLDKFQSHDGQGLDYRREQEQVYDLDRMMTPTHGKGVGNDCDEDQPAGNDSGIAEPIYLQSSGERCWEQHSQMECDEKRV